jgi:Fe-S oxidoreductase
MKLATYYRSKGDQVRFFKGDLRAFAAQVLCEEFLSESNAANLGKYATKFVEHIKTSKLAPLNGIEGFENSSYRKVLADYRNRYKNGDYPKFDVVCVTTLFTFFWKETVSTINEAKKFCASLDSLRVGGISASLLSDYVYEETGIHPHQGLLNKPGLLDSGDSTIIDELPLDYSILEEVDYQYPSKNAYFAYMTRGCPRKCSFCAVPKLEPEYCNYISLKPQLERASSFFGPQRDLLLMDNNVLASKHFDKIIDEIKDCGFEKGAVFIPPNEYDIAITNLKNGYNEYAYIRKILHIYDRVSDRLSESSQADFYLKREEYGCLYAETATKESILELDAIAKPLYDKHFKQIKQSRYVDFNQGVDARLITEKKMKKLSEINVRPLRIAFDHYGMREIYERAVRLAAKYNIRELSNYLLYNYEDKPCDLYYRMRMNVDLCEELGITIYSFPMKYHPIEDPEYFKNRDFIGIHWNRKFIRAVQAVLNATKGKIGRGKSFFDEAFGRNIEEFQKILWMPEAFIIHRMKYKGNLTAEWWNKFSALNETAHKEVENIICSNKFSDDMLNHNNPEIADVLAYYKVKRMR